jgi:branched-chain amino acid transport system substrate-binding protein
MKNRCLQFGSVVVALAAAGAMFLTGCSQPGDPNAIAIGEYASLTGREAAFGQSSHKGTMLAIEEINAAGGLLGKKINLIYEDNRSMPGESATIVKKLITRDKVVAVLGEAASGWG